MYNPRNGAEVKVPSGRPPESPHSSHILVSLSLKYASLHTAHSGPSCPSRQYALKSIPPRHASGHEVAEFLHSRIPLTSNFEPGEELGFIGIKTDWTDWCSGADRAGGADAVV